MDSEAVAQFVSVTGADAQQAAHFLDASKGDLNAAVAAFFATQDLGGPPASSSAAARSSSPAVPVEAPRPTPRIATFASTANAADKDKNTYYAGGEKSGVAVQGPPDANKPPSSVDDIMKIAAQGGPRPPADSSDAEFDDDDDEEVEDDRRPKVQAFTGQGFRLGTEQEGSSVASSSAPAADDPAARAKPKKVSRLLTFWQDGFSIEDGPLYPYSDPQSQRILEELKSGRAPLHILNVQPNQPVDLRIAHKTTEQYKAPPAKPFSGQGNRLGSLIPGDPTPSSSSASSAAAPRAATAPAVPATLNVTVDQSQPTTTLQIRLADGTRMVTKFNHSHTVGQLRAIVAAARSDSSGRSFTLSTTFPMKVLTEDAQTLEQAGLLNSVVVQKWA
ncbi:ubiquitin-related domain-containing protein [Catenaria anguillulae PL171]|uniref:Ubiquitin-related domain-containing protein n=1 Tax=Catenaria anguillulae PL171 TaxID=765915 RepID=A0A1Y2HMX2_9FUNG|nr:ubiquitin-related domain-containing protein [Catenaria anguillulae PL171]